MMPMFFTIFLTFRVNIYSVWSEILKKCFSHSVSTRFSGPLIFGRSSWVLVTNDVEEVKNVIPF